MKKLKYLFVFSILALFFACDDDYEALNDLADVDWYTSGFQSEKQLNIEDYMSFSDLSQGAIDHSWTFSDTSGCKFLTGIISRNDSTYYPFIDENAGNTSQDETVSVLFTKPGLQKLRLRNTFSKYVEFIGADTLAAVKQGDVWVIDTTFMIDVFDTIQSAFKVYHNDIEIASIVSDQQSVLADTATWPTYEIQAGEALNFVDLTEIGRPNTTAWAANGGAPANSSDSSAIINYYRLGTFYTKHTASRSGQNIPGAMKMKYVPLKIKVIKSTLPFGLVGGIVEQADETLQISVSGELVNFSGQEDYFTVHVTNPNGFDQVIPVASASKNSSQGNVINLKLSQAIYGNDKITVSYAGGDLVSLDDRILNDFTDVSVTPHVVTLTTTSVYGFENGANSWISTDDPTVEYSTEQAASGNYSLKLTSVAGDSWTRSTSELSAITLAGGKTYTVTFKVWIEEGTTAGSMGPWFYWNDGAGGQQFWTSLKDLPRGEWITRTRDQAVPASGPGYFSFRVKGDAVLYFDDVTISETDNRP